METILKRFLVFALLLQFSSGTTDTQDTAALRALMSQWQYTPPSWGQSDDPCGTPWEGISCSNSRVTVLKLSTMGIKGTLSGDIGQLSELQSLDLSYNKELRGTLPPDIGNLKKLTTLILAGCSFSGTIPYQIGSLGKLSYLALNSNQLGGKIPASLGNLSKLYWLDVADNQLTGPLPISTENTPGLDKLINTKHFHFNKNQLTGPIPETLFSSEMTLIHVLFDGNKLTGTVPTSLGLVQTLEVVRLDRNTLSGPVPSNLNNLTHVNELNLANNQLSGSLPDLTGMNALNYVDLSNNTFDPSKSPIWFSDLQALTALIIQSGGLYGKVPQELFSLPQLQQVILDNNEFNGTLDMGSSISEDLSIVSFKNNAFTSLTVNSVYNGTLILAGNPVCDKLTNTQYCNLAQKQQMPYSTSLTKCSSNSCPLDQSLSPQSCTCQYPYEGVMYFRAPFFRDVTNSSLFQSLEMSLWTKLDLTPGSVFLQDPFFNGDSYLQVQVKLFPSGGNYFNRSEIMRIGFDLSNQTYKPPHMFGPYYFIASPYPFQAAVEGRGSSKNTALIIGIAVGCALLVVALFAAGIYAVKQKQRANRAMELSRPFASWSRTEDSSGAPQLKGARWFSYDELKKSTNNFSESNELGFGGYGKVYRGMLPNGQLVAIKRARQGSMQGSVEFKTEIELLSRVHHKNLVGLVGFCFEQEEQMLVYEFVANGTLRDCLSGKSGIYLDWKRRLRVALGSARGLSYLHELADPPIIHRDVKSTNILLDENLTAKVSDFGLSKLVSDSEKGHISTQVKGTLGYLDPEYYMMQQLTEKSDVYSFGVVMLELITARQPIEKGKYVVREVKQRVDMNDEEYCSLKELMDPKVLNTTHLIAFNKFVQLALRCVEESAASRPTMSDIVKEIETMLHSDGLNTNSTSASSSATDFGSAKGAPHHPYDDSSIKKDVSSGAFEYSGGYLFAGKIEPK
ncbi:probable leucine-rich repeat receptor-like protein kinase At5g49770 isoform X1 [Ananas comosus]|uniref:non-specific serine/threonine protein kinase n=1 Tax=Ananas comosus TaxID=4615 RepID=A0A6P5GTV9_ANACO|nr:probable leucine-rich repeat receptor-like protein kinase At5g49770 isoform X1 [Ananas comosus]